MAKRTRSIYGSRDPREIPAYPVFEAARYLGMAENTLRTWIGGKAGFEPVIELPADAEQLSFYNLVEAFVIFGLRRKHHLSLQQVRRDAAQLRALVPNSAHPLAQLDLATFAREIYLDDGEELTNVSRPGQLGFNEILRTVLERVEKDVTGIAARLYPFTRPGVIDNAPKVVVIDPLLSFGRPTIVGTGIPTAVLHERWKAGDSVVSLAEDYDRPAEEIEEALRYEAA